jgi:hypothetical protein
VARDITGEAVTVVPARTVVVNTATEIITAAHDSMALTPNTVARAIYYDGGSYPTTATTRVGRTRTGATAHPGDITHTHTMAVTRTIVTQQLLFLLHANVRL